MTDQSKARRARNAGNRTDIDRLLRERYDDVARICRRICANPADADDATQAALIAIARGIDSFDGASHLSTWIYRVATNAALDELRRQRRHSDRVGLEIDRDSRAAEPHVTSPDTPADLVVERDTVDRMMQSLAPGHRAVLVLRDAIGCDYAEIAEVLGIELGTVKSRVSRARASAAHFLEVDGIVEADRTDTPGTIRPNPTSKTEP